MTDKALKAFEAMRHDVEQFDAAPMPEGGALFSERVPLYMKSYLVNWLRNYMRDFGDETEAALGKKPATDQPVQ